MDDESAGRMTLEFRTNGEGSTYPIVSFEPIGKITAALIERNLGFLYKQIQIAQVQSRTAAGTETAPRRRRAA